MEVKNLVYIAEYFCMKEETYGFSMQTLHGLVTTAKIWDINLNGYLDLNSFELIMPPSTKEKFIVVPDIYYMKRLYPYNIDLNSLELKTEEKELLEQQLSDTNLFRRVSLAKHYTMYLKDQELSEFWLFGQVIKLNKKSNLLEFVKESQVLANNFFAVDLETFMRYDYRPVIDKETMELGGFYFIPTMPAIRKDLTMDIRFLQQMITAFDQLCDEEKGPILKLNSYKNCDRKLT